MAKYNVKFSCGHEEVVQLFGKNSDRERKIRWYEDCGVCSCCYREQKAMEMAITHEEIEMHYGEYKKNYPKHKTKPGSYNGKTKMITVYIPKSEM